MVKDRHREGARFIVKTSTGDGANYLEAVIFPKNRLFKKFMKKMFNFIEIIQDNYSYRCPGITKKKLWRLSLLSRRSSEGTRPSCCDARALKDDQFHQYCWVASVKTYSCVLRREWMGCWGLLG